MQRLLNILLQLALITAVLSTTVRKCSNGAPMPLSVDIQGCDEPPCDAIKGTTAIMDVHFVGTQEEIKKLTTKVLATAAGVTVPYDLPQQVADVCSNLLYGAICPIYATEDVVYEFKFYIDMYYPAIPLLDRTIGNEPGANSLSPVSFRCFDGQHLFEWVIIAAAAMSLRYEYN